ncbi:TraB/GumN family protein [Dyadobacter luteus]|uniref:TraB/GumN family protein n=1 Tax=Dyadobacter luteus TaxID=2259619 RepID=A0A3D8YCJ9_9BACT|nr:TraB/GumN family protein [Dyadobacter luteus]REA59951.1 TraB/GumN family protein [Dyadobacter luteus]
MKKGILFFLLGLLTLKVSAQVPTEKTLLWEIKAPGASKSSYLFGTIHLICPDDFYLSDALKSAITKTEQVALEMDMDDPAMMGKMMQTMNMKPGNQLSKLVSDAEYKRLAKFYKDSVGVGLAMFENAKPFVLMGPLFTSVLGCEPKSYEMALVELAGKQKSEVIGLETVEEQMGIFDTIPYKDQVKMLLSMIDSLPQARKEFRDLVNLYKSENIQELYTATTKSSFGMEENQDIMLYDRNKKWIGRIKNIIAEKSTLFAVGAAHLGGEKGVIALLRKEGYTVTSVKQ